MHHRRSVSGLARACPLAHGPKVGWVRCAFRFARPRLPFALLAILCSLGSSPLTGCGGSNKKVNYTPATPEQLRVFENGVDFVAALEGIEGRWREDWDRDLQERVGSADFIGTIHVQTLLTETDPEQVVTHRLVGHVTRTIAGGEEKTIELRVREGEKGFPTVHDNLTRIQSRDFLAYVKWSKDDAGERAAHFHLSPASEAVVSETERVVALRKGASKQEADGGRTIVHTH